MSQQVQEYSSGLRSQTQQEAWHFMQERVHWIQQVPLKPRSCERGKVIWMKSIGTREEQDYRKDYRILKGSDGLQFHGLDDFFVA